MGADILIDYRTQDFVKVLRDYDVVLNSQNSKTLEKSLRMLKCRERLISISGPPDPSFGKEIAAPGCVRLVMRLLRSGVRRRASRGVARYFFLLMKSNGKQRREIASLFDQGVLRPAVNRVFPFASTNEALAYVKSSRAKGEGVIQIQST